jgi:hypothetical protein
MQVYNTPIGSEMETGAPMGASGLTSTFLRVDGGRSWISGSTHRGPRRRRSLTLMVGAPGSPSARARGAIIDVFLMLMVGAPRSLSAPTRGPAVDIF